MAKDRARPFSRKHRRYWVTVTGGMLFIMAINVGLGVWLYDTKPRTLPPITQPPATLIDAGADAAALDGGASAPGPVPAPVAPR